MTDSARPRPRPGPHPASGESREADRPAAPSRASRPADNAVGNVATPKPRRAARIAAVAICALVLVTLAVVTALLAIERSHHEDLENAGIGAMTNARNRVPALLSYNYKTVDRYVADSPKNTTGAFKKEFTNLITTVIAPAAEQQQIVTKVTVKAVGVIDAHPRTIVLLVLLDQATTYRESPTAHIETSGRRVTMTRRGDTWLVSQLKQI